MNTFSNPNLHAFLFDLDGVLIDTESQYGEFWEGETKRYLLECLDFKDRIKGNTLEFILTSYFKEEVRGEVQKRFYDLEKTMSCPFYPNALDVLKCLHEKKYKIAIVTSSDDVKMHSLKTQCPELFQYVDYLLTAEDMKVSKPAPDCWWQAAERLGVEISQCVILEDSINGLKSAYASGGYVIGVATTLPPKKVRKYSHEVIHEIKELLL